MLDCPVLMEKARQRLHAPGHGLKEQSLESGQRYQAEAD